jgi:hypothetical protein
MANNNGNGGNGSLTNWKQFLLFLVALLSTGLVSWSGVKREVDDAKERIRAVELLLEERTRTFEKIEAKLDRLLEKQK